MKLLSSALLFLIVGTIQISIESKAVLDPASTKISTTSHFTTCSKGKKLPHPENPNKYFQCQFISKADVWLTQPFNCLHQQIFDEGQQACINIQQRINNRNNNSIISKRTSQSEGRLDIIPTFPTNEPSTTTLKYELKPMAPLTESVHHHQNELDDENTNKDLIVKLTSTVESLASTVQILVKNNQNSNKIIPTVNIAKVISKDDENYVDDDADDDDDDSVSNENSILRDPDENPWKESDPSNDHEVTAVLLNKNKNDNHNHKEPFHFFVHQPHNHETVQVKDQIFKQNVSEGQHLNKEEEAAVTSESTEDVIVSPPSAEPNNNSDNSFENLPDNSFLKMFLKNFLPRPKIHSPIIIPPHPLRRNDGNGLHFHRERENESKIFATTTPHSTRLHDNEHEKTTQDYFNLNKNSSTLNNKLSAFEYHFTNQPTTTAPPTLFNNKPNQGNLINLVSLFKRLTRDSDEDEDISQTQTHHHIQGFNHHIPFFSNQLPQRLLNSNNNHNNDSPFIFQRIPMSSSSLTSPILASPAHNNNNNWTFFPNNPQVKVNSDNTQSQSIESTSTNLREPRQNSKILTLQ